MIYLVMKNSKLIHNYIFIMSVDSGTTSSMEMLQISKKENKTVSTV